MDPTTKRHRAARDEPAAAPSGPVTVLAVLAVSYTLYLARGLLLPFVGALVAAAILAPPVRWLRAVGVPNLVAAALVVIVVLGAAGTGVYYLTSQADAWVERIPEVSRRLRSRLGPLKSTLERARATTDRLRDITDIDGGSGKGIRTVEAASPGLGEQLLSWARSAVVTILVLVMLIYFLLAQGPRTLHNIEARLRSDDQRIVAMVPEAQRQIGAYLRTVALINLTLGAVASLAMLAAGMPSPLLWGALTGGLNFVPYLGPMVAVALTAAGALVTFDTWVRTLLPPLLLLGLTSLEGQLITPMVLGKSLTINPILVLTAILFWSFIWGVVGALLAVPILVAVKIVVNNVDSLGWLRGLFS